MDISFPLCPDCHGKPETWHERAAYHSKELYWAGCRRCGHLVGAISELVAIELWEKRVFRLQFEKTAFR